MDWLHYCYARWQTSQRCSQGATHEPDPPERKRHAARVDGRSIPDRRNPHPARQRVVGRRHHVRPHPQAAVAPHRHARRCRHRHLPASPVRDLHGGGHLRPHPGIRLGEVGRPAPRRVEIVTRRGKAKIKTPPQYSLFFTYVEHSE